MVRVERLGLDLKRNPQPWIRKNWIGQLGTVGGVGEDVGAASISEPDGAVAASVTAGTGGLGLAGNGNRSPEAVVSIETCVRVAFVSMYWDI